MPDFAEQILAAVGRKSYQPVKPKALARKLGVPQKVYGQFRNALRDLVRQGRVEFGKSHVVRPAGQHGTVVGLYRRTSSGLGFVRPHVVEGQAGADIAVRADDSLDASSGDEVLVKLVSKGRAEVGPRGVILQILARATRQFVGTYFERDGAGHVRVDGTVFSHSIYVGDPGARGARPDDKVVIEMLRFPSQEDYRGEAVIVEVLGPRGRPGVDTLSIVREYGLPDKFPEDVLEEARAAADAFREDDLAGRTDFTRDLVVTIDPADARDFDDAVSVTIDPRSRHWQLAVHIADVAHFCPPGGALDREARKRGTSVYLPQRVLPMFPEIISNSLASLQQARVRYVKSAVIDFTPTGQRTKVSFHEGAIRARKRFTYEQVSRVLETADAHGARRAVTADIDAELVDLLSRMRDLAMILRKRRHKRGALELNMPEVELEFDDQGRVSGAHFVKHDVSHQIIEEFMLAANEAVAERLADLGVPFLRRVHPAPEPTKLEGFRDFARSLGYKVEKNVDRFTLQRILEQSAERTDVYAVHYSLLRSLKQAVYSPDEEAHYALASETYCHFTSPIRRYPDLTVHRLLGRWLRTGKAGSDEEELRMLGQHCSKMERRADLAERELIKTKLLAYLEERLGMELEVVITGVADYGFFGQAERLPVEGLVHISTLTDDYYYHEEATHSLTGRRTGRTYRLGDKVHVKVVRVDPQRRQLDFRVSDRRERGDRREETRHPPRRRRRRHGNDENG
jgi:ribonuclease R